MGKKIDARYYIAINLLFELGYTQKEISEILLLKMTRVSNFKNGDCTREGSKRIHEAIVEYVLDNQMTFCGIRTYCDANYDFYSDSVKKIVSLIKKGSMCGNPSISKLIPKWKKDYL